MSFLDYNVDDAQEPTTVPPGEYALNILNAEIKDSQKGEKYLGVRLGIEDQPTAKDINHVIMLPASGQDEKTLNRRKWDLKCFYKAFDVDASGQVELESLKGLRGWAVLGEEDSEQYGKQNRVKQFVSPK